MKIDFDKIDEMTLALLYVVMTKKTAGSGAVAWKGLDLNTLLRMHKKGWIEEPKSRDMSLRITEKGYKQSSELFKKYFTRKEK